MNVISVTLIDNSVGYDGHIVPPQLMNDRLIDMLAKLATDNPHRKHIVLLGESWNMMSMPPGGSSKSQLIDSTDIRGSIAKFVEANELQENNDA
jgi:hypothetical protein